MMILKRKKTEDKYIVHFDGSCAPNNINGVVGYGYIIARAGVTVREESAIAFVGGRNATSNVAEYLGLINCLTAVSMIKRPRAKEVIVYGDSKLVINQVNGEWRAKHENIKPFAAIANVMIDEMRSAGIKVSLQWVGRGGNSEAHHLSKKIVKEARKDRLSVTVREKAKVSNG